MVSGVASFVEFFRNIWELGFEKEYKIDYDYEFLIAVCRPHSNLISGASFSTSKQHEGASALEASLVLRIRTPTESRTRSSIWSLLNN